MIKSLDTFIPKAYESIGTTYENVNVNHSNYTVHQTGGKGKIRDKDKDEDKRKSRKSNSNYGIPKMYYSSKSSVKCRKRNCNKDMFDILDNQALDDNIMNRLFERSMHKHSRIQQNPSKLKISRKSRKLNNLKKHRENPKTKKRVR